MKFHSILFLLAMAAGLQADVGPDGVPSKKKTAPAPAETPSSGWKKPEWLTELSLTFRESYDSNVYYCHSDPNPGQRSLTNQDSLVSTINPRFTLNFVPLLGIQTEGFEKLTLTYNPVINYYHAETGENYTAHNVGNQVKGKVGDFSYDLNSVFTVVDGSDTSLPYPNGFNAFVPAPVIRNRRAQTDEVGKLVLRYDLNPDWFVRTTAQTLYQDFSVRMMSQVPGYLNFIDRYDVNVGPDVGYNVTKAFAVALGWRAGHQHQSIFNGNSDSNNYQRILAGLEGKPVSWLQMNVSAGPDFRHYGNDVPNNQDRNFRRIYCDALFTVTATKQDSFTLLVRQWQGLSTTSVTPLEDQVGRFGYKRQWTKDFSSEVFAQYADYNYDTPLNRDDDLETYGLSLVYQLTPNVTLDWGYSLDRGGSAYIPGAAQPVGRDLTRHLASMGIKYSF